MLLPAVVRDARFRAGRTLVTRGKPVEATAIFVQLLDSARQTYGDDHVECAAAYYEYGNALFRCIGAAEEEKDDADGKQGADPKEPEETTTRKRSAAAEAAERRAASGAKKEDQNQEDKKLPPAPTSASAADDDVETTTASAAKEESDKANNEKHNNDEEVGNDEENDDEEEEDDGDDMGLSLEMMETAWSILDKHMSSAADENGDDASPPKYQEWGTEQLPRYMTGIGDVLSALERFADAAEIYSQALEHRQSHWEALLQSSKSSKSNGSSTSPPTLEQLVCRRRIVDLYVLMAEQFLAAPSDQDVVTSETQTLLCKAGERVEYAQGYYNKARDELQETVVLMGQLVSSSGGKDETSQQQQDGLAEEKENICFTSTLLMNLGTSLAALEEEEEEDEPSKQPAKKKSKQEN